MYLGSFHPYFKPIELSAAPLQVIPLSKKMQVYCCISSRSILVSPITVVIPLPHGLNGLYMGVPNHVSKSWDDPPNSGGWSQ